MKKKILGLKEMEKTIDLEQRMYNSYLTAFTIFSHGTDLSSEDKDEFSLKDTVAVSIAANDIRNNKELKTKSELIQEVERLTASSEKGRIEFRVGCNEVMRFENNGDIFVKGNKVENNSKVVSSFKEWLRKAIDEQKSSKKSKPKKRN